MIVVVSTRDDDLAVEWEAELRAHGFEPLRVRSLAAADVAAGEFAVAGIVASAMPDELEALAESLGERELPPLVVVLERRMRAMGSTRLRAVSLFRRRPPAKQLVGALTCFLAGSREGLLDCRRDALPLRLPRVRAAKWTTWLTAVPRRAALPRVA